MDNVFFETQTEFRKWLEEHHDTVSEIWMGYYKKGSGRGGITYQQSLDEALCFGWIDGIRKSIDEVSYCIRFTPRKARSIWSDVNKKRVAELTELGVMHPAGLKAFNERDPERSTLYSFEQKKPELSESYQERLRENARAWEFFQSQPPSYRRTAAWWVMSAKREETRQRRLETLIECSEKGRKPPPFLQSGE